MPLRRGYFDRPHCFGSLTLYTMINDKRTRCPHLFSLALFAVQVFLTLYFFFTVETFSHTCSS